MAELFIELFGEEIPARMQKAAESRLRDALLAGLAEAGLGGENPQSWSGPRRLAVSVGGIAAKEADISEERRGPRADAPEQAVAGFLKSAGISRDQAEVRSTPKGDFLFALIDRKGREATAILPEMISTLIGDFTWPKTMRWGTSRKGWVRPLHRITVLFDGKPLAGQVDLGGEMALPFGAETEGHRMLAPGVISLSGGASYAAALEAAHVIADRETRKDMISTGLSAFAGKHSASASAKIRACSKKSPVLSNIRTLSWGRSMMISCSCRVKFWSRRCAATRNISALKNADGTLAPYFATVSNMTADDARDAVIRAGNERVLRARLADARFFWDQDYKTPLDSMVDRLGEITFFEGLGSMQQKAERLADLAAFIADGDTDTCRRAGHLAKADLVSQTVGEFPEMQGVIGGYLARHGGEVEAVADAVAEHYRPEGPGMPFPPLTLVAVLHWQIRSTRWSVSSGSVPCRQVQRIRLPCGGRRSALSASLSKVRSTCR